MQLQQKENISTNNFVTSQYLTSYIWCIVSPIYVHSTGCNELPFSYRSFSYLHHFDDLLDASVEVVDAGSHKKCYNNGEQTIQAIKFKHLKLLCCLTVCRRFGPFALHVFNGAK